MQAKKNKGLIFWNVDTQYDFMREYGALYVPGAESIEPWLKILTDVAEQEGIRVINTADMHEETSAELSDDPDFANTFPPHCMRGSAGARYVWATAVDKSYIIDWKDKSYSVESVLNTRNLLLTKDQFDVFTGSPHTEGLLELLSPKEVIVYGVATNYCVDFAVTGLAERGYDVIAVTDAMKELPVDLPGKTLEATLEKWKDAEVRLATVDEMVRYVS